MNRFMGVSSTANKMLNGLKYGAVLLPLALAGCKQPVDPQARFVPEAGTYAEAQTVQVTLPATAKNVYLTTDAKDPIADEQCAFASGSLMVNRPMLIKLAYDVDNVHYEYEKLYIIENNIQESGFLNRNVITAWERFFYKHVLSQFPRPEGLDVTQRLDAENGGRAFQETRIRRTNEEGDPREGEQVYSFEFFGKVDADTGEDILIQSGSIYGFRNESGGYYTTRPSVIRGRGLDGSVIAYSGDYNGWAEGDFKLDVSGRPESGYYQVYCTDKGCDDAPVVYALTARNHFIEVDNTPDVNTRSCGEPDAAP